MLHPLTISTTCLCKGILRRNRLFKIIQLMCLHLWVLCQCNGIYSKGRKYVLTDTPTKDEIAAIEANKKLKSVKKRVLSEEKRKPKKAKKKTNKNSACDAEEDAVNDCFCLCCLESYTSSRPNQKWVQCLECKGWSHEDCTGGELQYVGHNCLSD